jgi:hypothetical protein
LDAAVDPAERGVFVALEGAGVKEPLAAATALATALPI